jgi:predicted RNA binding protein YcfA (HicA-like mRNA interferase family)
MSQRLPSLKPREVLQALRRAGFFVRHVSGSHYILKHPDNPARRVTLPFHTKDLKRGTLLSIIEEAGLTTDAFMHLLS